MLPKTKLKMENPTMVNNDNLSWITNYIWGIADDVLRDLYVRGKYRDVILPMTVLRRMDAVLEDNKQALLDMKKRLDDAGVVEQDQALRQAAGQAFYNTSTFTLRELMSRPIVNSSRLIFKLTWTVSRRTYRTSSRILSSAIRFHAFQELMLLALL